MPHNPLPCNDLEQKPYVGVDRALCQAKTCWQ